MKKLLAPYRKENDMNTAEVYLFGSLSRESEGNKAHPIQYALQEPIPLNDLFDCLGIFSDRVQLAMVNYRAVSLDHVIHPGDRIALFAKEYAIFADWKNFRA
jgi:molybdopterin converting factor small subunit